MVAGAGLVCGSALSTSLVPATVCLLRMQITRLGLGCDLGSTGVGTIVSVQPVWL